MAKTADTIAIYSRKSRYTGKGESIENQIDLCREYIRTHYGDAAAEHAVVFEDEGFPCRKDAETQKAPGEPLGSTAPLSYTHPATDYLFLHAENDSEPSFPVHIVWENGFGGVRMLLTLLQFFASKFLVLALHLEAGSFPRPLSPQEEIRTFAALRAGDSSAREKLIRHNLRLVAHIAKKYYALPSEQDDLISIGTIGLMKAVDTFDSTRRARFSTYASRCIENELRMHFRRERKNAPTLSLQETLDAGKEDSALTLADVLQDGFCMEDSCEKQDDAQRLRRLIEGLPARERKLILLRYGLAGQPPLTQLETAKLLQISRSYVSRLETHALELLRAGWEQS